MANDAEVIKEFLISLGFKADENSQRKFSSNIAWATARVQLFTKALLEAGEKVYESGKDFVKSFENLYFASQRTGAAIANIEAFSHAAENLGASSQEALGTLENLGHFLRVTPGAEGFIHSLGVQTRDANGQLRDTADTLIDIGKRLGKMDFAHANAYAGVLGIDEHTLIALRNGSFEAEYRKSQDRLKQGNFQQAGEDAHKFMSQVRNLGQEFTILGVQIEAALLRTIGPRLDEFLKWMQDNGPMLAQRIADIANGLIRFVDAIAPLFTMLLSLLTSLDQATGGWSTEILALAAAFKLLGGNITSTIAGAMKLPGALSGASGWLGAAGGVAAAGGLGYAAGTVIYDNLLAGGDFADKLGGALVHAMAFLGNDEAQKSIDLMNRANVPNGSAGGKASIAQKTDIHVYSTDPKAAGSAVANEQDRINQRMLRNLGTVAAR